MRQKIWQKKFYNQKIQIYKIKILFNKVFLRLKMFKMIILFNKIQKFKIYKITIRYNKQYLRVNNIKNLKFMIQII